MQVSRYVSHDSTCRYARPSISGRMLSWTERLELPIIIKVIHIVCSRRDDKMGMASWQEARRDMPSRS